MSSRGFGPLPDKIHVVRPHDLLVITVRFHGLTLRSGDLVPEGTEGLIILDFPPQAILEQASMELGNIPLPPGEPGTPAPPPPLGASKAAFSGPSRLAFLVTGPVNAGLHEILEFCKRGSDLRVRIPPPPPPGQTPFDADPESSAVELPYGVVLRENDASTGTWNHSSGPVSSLAGTVELWHTRLVDAADLQLHRETGVDVRAVWGNRDNAGIDPASLSPQQRRDLQRYGQSGSVPPVRTRLLMLTALGGWLDAEADWTAATAKPSDGLPPPSLVYWRHRMTMGRDHYVRVIDEGHLFPFGHPAALVKVSERKIQPDPNGTPVGYLRQQMYLIVRCPHMTYTGLFANRRDFPFKSVSITTLSTPDLRDPTETELVPNAGGRAFWPTVGPDQAAAVDVPFHLRAVDTADNVVEFTMPLAFVARGMADQIAGWMTDDGGFLSADARARSRRRRSMAGQRLAFGGLRNGLHEPAQAVATSFETDLLEFGAELAGGGMPTVAPEEPPPAGAQPSPFHPSVRRARARVPAIRELTGSKAAVAFEYHDNYRKGSGTHPLDVFARLVEDDGVAPPKVEFTREQAGGLAAPNMVVTTLSTSRGPLGPTGEPKARGALFNPSDFFQDDPLLLGGLALKALLAETSAPDSVPKVVSSTRDGVSVTHLHWETTALKAIGPFVLRSEQGQQTKLSIDVTREAPAGGQVKLTSRGQLHHFALSLVELVQLPFEKIEFVAETGKKVDLAVDLGEPQFIGQLRFVQTIIDALPLKGFVDPPAVDVSPDGVVKVGYSLGIPTVGLGYVTLQNLSLAAAVNLPLLSGSASLTFSFAERHNPFIVTYSALGGGGFFGITLGLDKVEMLEASVEFGGAFALNLGVASGAANLTAGFYYGLIGDKYVFSGFVRAAGSLEVLGILSVSAEFYLALTYDPGLNIAIGSATLTVKVKLLFVSKSVELTVQREFPGPPDTRSLSFGAPPALRGPVTPEDFSFEKTIDLAEWRRYCRAFADE